MTSLSDKFNRARKSMMGRPPAFKKPEDLAIACADYFQWLDDNPFMETKLVSYQGKTKKKKLPHPRMPTIVGLCLHIGTTETSWGNWRNSGPAHREDLAPVIARVEAVIRSDKMEGAAAEMYSTALVMRDLGMTDKTAITGPDDGPIKLETTSDVEVARRVAWLLQQGIASEGK